MGPLSPPLAPFLSQLPQPVLVRIVEALLDARVRPASGDPVPEPLVALLASIAPAAAPGAFVSPAPAPGSPTEAPLASPFVPPVAVELGAAAWKELRVTPVDGHTVRFSRGRRSVRRTFLDLGLADRRWREPTDKFTLFRELCDGYGTVSWHRYGNFNAGKQAIFVLNRTLQAAVGLRGSAFHRGSERNGWRAKFLASPERDDE